MSGATRPKGLSLGELAFFSIWLLGWTLGVAVIQGMTLSEPFSPTSLFLFTHGGAEVLVLTILARRIRAAAQVATVPPELTRDHAGLTASWTVGTGNPVLALAASLLGVVVHLGLVSPLLLAISEPTLWSILLSVPLLGVWAYTAVTWASAVKTHADAREEVALEADFDAVTIRQGSRTTELPTVGLIVGDGPDGEVTLASGGALWTGRVAVGSERTELLDALRVMGERATPMQNVEEPEAMRRLRGVEPA
jgi:hypothetical protein